MDKKLTVTSTPLARYHQVLLAVASHSAGVNLNELVKLTRLPRSSAHRIAAALCGVQYLALDSAGLYTLGDAFQNLIKRSLTADNRLQAFQPALQYLVSELGETAFFARYVEGKVNLAHAVTPKTPTRSYIYPGTGPRPLETCSSSKAILAFTQTEAVRQMYEAGALQLEEPSSFQSFLDHLRQVERNGYAICDGEIDEGVFSLACPVHIGPMKGLYSIGVVGPTSRMKAVEIQGIVNVVQKAANIAAENLVHSVDTRI